MNHIERRHTNARMSKFVRHAGIVYLCGQTSSGSSASGVAEQTYEVLSRIDTLLAEAGSGRDRLLAATVYLHDIADFAAMNEAWEAWLPAGAAPARTTVEARLAAPELRVEITVTAAA
ncbi:MAG: RidA family protein [Proteobacteria bacterium]|nr:RidA family protein [Pseudomonadota bacterium]